MCVSKVFLIKDENHEHVMSDVVRMEMVDGGIKVYDIIGNERFIKGTRMSYADILAHEIILVTDKD